MRPCPPTAAPSGAEHAGRPVRCYKIGNGRRSYNPVELRLTDGCGRTAAIHQCLHAASTTEEAALQESSIAFHVVLPGCTLLCRLFLVYDVPQLAGEPDAASSSDDGGGGSAALCSWRLVRRSDCTRGCKGPLLATSRRLSGLGKRPLAGAGAGPAKSPDGSQGAAAKGAQQMFVSIDEACTHCGASAFRLVAAIYAQAVQPSAAPSSGGEHGSASGAAAATEQQQTAERQRAHQQPEAPAERLLAASVSPLIKVLANNDTPTGPGRIPLEVALPADWEGWLDPAVWCFSRDSLESSSAQLPASSTPLQPHRLVHGRSEPSLAAAAGSASAGWQLPQQPTAADCLRSSTPVMMAPQAQPVMPVGTAGAAGAARHGSWPLQGHQLPSAEAAEAAVVAARRQRQQARQAATAESPLQPLPPLPGSRPGSQLCFPDATPTLSHQGVAAAAQPPLAQPSVTVGRLAEAEAMLAANGGAIVTRVPGGYRVVRVAGAPAARPSPSPWALQRSAQAPAASSDSMAAASYGSSAATSFGGMPFTPADRASVQWSAPAPPLPRMPVPPPPAVFPWAEQQRSASSVPQGAQLLPPDAYDVAAISGGAGAWPPLPGWPPRQASLPQQAAPPLPAGASMASSSTTTDPGSLGALQWAAYQSALVHQADMQLVTAGLAAAGRLGLLPGAARQQAPTASQPAWHGGPSAQRGHQQVPGAAVAPAQHDMPDLPSEAQLLSLADEPSAFDPMGSIFDGILPHEPRT